MHKVIAAVLLLAGTACAPRPRVRVAPGIQLANFRRIGVLPFQDPGGQGAAVADAVARGLVSLGFSIVDAGVMERAFGSLRLEPGAQLSIADLLELRRATQADALAFGVVEPAPPGRPRRVSLLLIEAQLGELLAQGSFPIPASRDAGLADTEAAVVRALEGAQ